MYLFLSSSEKIAGVSRAEEVFRLVPVCGRAFAMPPTKYGAI